MDPRVTKLADILVNYSTKVKPGDTVQIVGDTDAAPLIKEVYKKVVQKGAFPRLKVGLQGLGHIYYKYASDRQIRTFPQLEMDEMKKTDVYIAIISSANKKELALADNKKMAIRSNVTKPITHYRVDNTRWVLTLFPTNAYAQDADMPLEEFETTYYRSTNIDWAKESKKQDKLKRIMDKGSEVHISGEETDIRLSIEGRQGIKCDGHFNMPDGEVFTSPVEDSAEGNIYYSFPGIYAGKEVEGIRLRFKKGKVVRATAEKNERFLKEMLNTDAAAKRLGELGIGTNFGITRFIKNTLLDEKIGGTVHLALGSGYTKAGGKNKSAIHWDMIKDLRNNGVLKIDGKTILKNGKFVI